MSMVVVASIIFKEDEFLHLPVVFTESPNYQLQRLWNLVNIGKNFHVN